MQQAKQDIEGILSATTEFAMRLEFKAPTNEECETTGQFFDRTAVYDINQTDVSGNHVVVHVSEQPFQDADYPVRTENSMIAFKGHKVRATYADGSQKVFKVFDTQPDYSINMITLQLEHYAGSY